MNPDMTDDKYQAFLDGPIPDDPASTFASTSSASAPTTTAVLAGIHLMD